MPLPVSAAPPLLDAPSPGAMDTGAMDISDARVYIVDDEPANVILLKRMLEGAGFRGVSSATDPRQALATCLEQPPDLLMLDLMMPHLSGYEIIEQLRAAWGDGERVPILVLTADSSREACRRALTLGANDFIGKPIDRLEMLLRARNLLENRLLDRQLRATNLELEARVALRTRELERRNADLHDAQIEALEKLAQAAEFRDDDTGNHIRRVGNCAELLSLEVGLPFYKASLIGSAAPLHDIGKIAIPDSILLKPARLTPDEFEIMKTHAALGAALLSHSLSPLMQCAEIIARTHHERFDGTGYPHQISGQAIPLEGRIAAVIDVFDALTHERPYKKAWTIDAALQEIQSCAGTHFDPQIVAAFTRLPLDELI